MATKTTATSLLAELAQRKEDAAALAAYWEETLGIPAPSQQELLLAVKDCHGLDYLVQGVDAVAVKLSKNQQAVADGKIKSAAMTTLDAKNYMCGTARTIYERENPADRPMTPRRIRRSQVVTDPSFNADNWHEATPEETQKAMGIAITEQKKGKVQ